MNLESLLLDIGAKNSLIMGIISSPKSKTSTYGSKIVIRPVLLKTQLQYQISIQKGSQIFHQNVSWDQLPSLFKATLGKDFKQAVLYTKDADFHILVSKKQQMTILKKNPSKTALLPEHNRKKQYVLEEGSPIPFLIELGVMTNEGKVIAKKMDKFRQINRFLEMVSDVIPSLNKAKTIHVVDFGCGKAYLTFGLYHLLSNVHGFTVNMLGVDLKKEVIEKCRNIAKRLGYDGLHFVVGDINKSLSMEKVDLMVALHACDTATDAALEKGVRCNAAIILAAPCCQHELYSQVRSENLHPMLKHGIIKEKFASLATDSARAQLLEILGYKTQILEFIDTEHTPKNLLIRAVKSPSKSDRGTLIESYLRFKRALGITPSLEERFKEDLGFEGLKDG